MSHRFKYPLLLLCLVTVLMAYPALGDGTDKHHDSNLDWTQVADDPGWSPRAGLQVVDLRNNFYLMGGRTPIDPAIVPVFGASTMYSDVWKSRDRGENWELIKETEDPDSWPARAYFQAVTMKGKIFVLGGQNFKLAGYWFFGSFDTPPPSYIHPDHHGIVFHPDYDDLFNQTMFVTNDGGLWRTENALDLTS